ncbi:MAG: hypothetical protein ABEK16_05315 [Candidatus Nanohalobium sp.]
MNLADELEVYDPRRYMAVISVLNYRDAATADDIDYFSHAHPSLEPEVEGLHELGIVE